MMTSASMIKLAILALIVVVLVSSSFGVAQDDSDGPTTIQDLQTQEAQGEEADLQDDLSNGGRRLLKSASASASASSKSSSKGTKNRVNTKTKGKGSKAGNKTSKSKGTKNRVNTKTKGKGSKAKAKAG